MSTDTPGGAQVYSLIEGVIYNIFDRDWYLSQLQLKGLEVREEHLLRHYSRLGSSMLLSPHPLFDPHWYLAQNEDARRAFEGGIGPFDHFVIVGERRGYWPHPLFDVQWYRRVNGTAAARNVLDDFVSAPAAENRSTHPHFDSGWYASLHVDPQSWQQPAIIHFVCRGQACGYKPNPWGRYDAQTQLVITDPRPYQLSEYPLVSLIIPNLNGEQHLIDLLPSLGRQSYTNFELVFVDNGSDDGSVARVQAAFPDSNIIILDSNKGYAEANNIGFRSASGELIGLLNNDTVVSDHWLENLVRVMRSDVNLGAACPKIRFAGRFCELRLTARHPFAVDEQVLISSLDYKKIFASKGERTNGYINSVSAGADQTVELKLPFQERPFGLKVQPIEQKTTISFSTTQAKGTLDTGAKGAQRAVSFDRVDYRHSFFVINNAGGAQPGWLMTADIGFGSKDESQFDVERDVELLCGCAALIRRDALLGKELFLDKFVAYYEDSELSQRLRRSGFRIRYCPDAVVYHRHSSTTVERSAFWIKQVYRNRLLYRYLCSDYIERCQQIGSGLAELDREIEALVHSSRSQENRSLHEVLSVVRSEVLDLRKEIDEGALAVARPKRVGLFNAFWNTLGGGEAHALAFAKHFSRSFRVELISTEDFDIETLEKYFGYKPTRYIKRLVSELTPSVTAEYDIFINSSFMNECASRAKYSFFLVSFPSISPSLDFKQSYKFIANSAYTLKWMLKYWGDTVDTKIVRPCVSERLMPPAGAIRTPKEQIVLSVGRFFRGGHSKNQVLIADCFRRVCSNMAAAQQWKLVFIGSAGDTHYVDEVRNHLTGLNYELTTNASADHLLECYRRAFIYVHAAGLGEDPEHAPANFEHFGMTVAEAAANGCIPIVYDAAGPQEIVDMLGFGRKFNDIEELESELLQTMNSYSPEWRSPIDAVEQLAQTRLSRDLKALFSDIVPPYETDHA